jgi:hypothetical protein
MSGRNDEVIMMLRNIQTRLSVIEERIDEVKVSSGNMDDHINFIENLYNTIKWPFFKLLSVVQVMTFTKGTIVPPQLAERNQGTIETDTDKVK